VCRRWSGVESPWNQGTLITVRVVLAEEDKSTALENLTTRAFVLLRKLSKEGDLSPEEIHELVEIQKDMPSTSFDHKLEILTQTLEAQKEVLNQRLKSQDTKYDVLIWGMGIGFTLLLAFNFFGG